MRKKRDRNARNTKETVIFALQLTFKTIMIMYTIQANQSGTRTLEISEEHLQTIEKYALFQHLIDSNGIVDESVLDKLSLNVR